MTAPPSRFDRAAAELRDIGIALTSHPGTYCVNFRTGSTDATAYFSDDLDDAVEHGRAMAASAFGFIARGQRAQEAADRAIAEATGKEPRGRQRRPKKMTATAARRRMIRQHNRRMRARALRKQREQG